MLNEPRQTAAPRVGPDYFTNRAKDLVAQEFNSLPEIQKPIKPDEVFIVWFAKVLQNWKVVAGIYGQRDLYFEVTYNGDLSVAYVDTYIKTRNTAYDD